jgi:hypothetical protein
MPITSQGQRFAVFWVLVAWCVFEAVDVDRYLVAVDIVIDHRDIDCYSNQFFKNNYLYYKTYL